MDRLDFQALQLMVRQGRITWAELAPQLGLSAPAAAERVRRASFPGVPKQGAGVEFHAINGSNANGYDLGTDVHIYGTLRTLTTTPVPVPACF